MGATEFEAPQWESLAWLDSETVGRLCVLDLGYPLASPINYRMVQHLDVISISGRRFTSTTPADGFSVDWQPAAP
jgi:hypothetical protein